MVNVSPHAGVWVSPRSVSHGDPDDSARAPRRRSVARRPRSTETSTPSGGGISTTNGSPSTPASSSAKAGHSSGSNETGSGAKAVSSTSFDVAATGSASRASSSNTSIGSAGDGSAYAAGDAIDASLGHCTVSSGSMCSIDHSWSGGSVGGGGSGASSPAPSARWSPAPRHRRSARRRDFLAAPELRDGVLDRRRHGQRRRGRGLRLVMLRGLGVPSRELRHRTWCPQFRHLDTARSRDHPQVALGDRRSPLLVRDQLPPGQARARVRPPTARAPSAVAPRGGADPAPSGTGR